MIQSHADALAARLIEAREAYYNSENPLIGDAEFDALEEELRDLDPSHQYFTTVGISGGGAKIRHRVPMLSMGKAKNLEETEKWLKRLDLPSEAAITVQPKIDGLSASLYYREGRLRYVATRGDGEIGQDISHIASYVGDIPSTISFTGEPVEIRGELHLPKDTRYETRGKPLRNNCVGLINRKDDRENLHFVRFLAYQVVWPDAGHLSSGATAASSSAVRADFRLASEYEKIDILKENGFYTFDKWRLVSVASVETGDTGDTAETEESVSAADLVNQIGGVYEEYIDTLRDRWNFETDGLIIVVDNNTLHDEIDGRWVVDHHHHYALAFKPPSQAALTPLREVLWQVSRQGNLTPVAVFDPINMGGATLERASLHNAENVRRLKLAAGDQILVERANDVIPYVRDNPEGSDREDGFTDPALWPEVCPSCGSIPEDSGVNISCMNPECRDRVLQSMLYWVRQAEIGQVALKSLEALYDAGKLRTVRDLYTLKAEDFTGLEGFGDKKVGNFIDQVSNARSMSAVELISRLGIPMVQKKSLARLGIKTLNDFYSFGDDSYVIGQRIVQWKSEPGNMEFLNQLLEVIDIREDTVSGERRGVVCLTGKAPVPRKALSAALENRGWSVAGAVTRETILVVCDDPAGSSTKLKKARDAGIGIVTYEDFFRDEELDFS